MIFEPQYKPLIYHYYELLFIRLNVTATERQKKNKMQTEATYQHHHATAIRMD